MKINKTLNFSKWPYFDEEDKQKVCEILDSGKVNYWTGNEARLFEKEFANYIGIKYAVSLANGTVALELALKALDIQPDDEVIVTPRTFMASASSIVITGAKPVFADVDPVSQNITVETIKKVKTNKTKAIICVHLAGWPCDMPSIMKYANENNLYVIEDCAQAHGAKINDQFVGTFGHVSAYSFCQDKIMTTGGEGGMLVTNDKKIWSYVWSYKDHGKNYDAVYNMEHPPGYRWLINSFGSNLRISELHAALGRLALKKLPDWINTRRKYAKMMIDGFKNIEQIRLTLPTDNIYHSYYKFYCFIKPELLPTNWSRDKITAAISNQGIPCMSGTCSEIYLEKSFKNQPFKPNFTLPIARELGNKSMMFLVHPTLTEDHIKYVIDVTKQTFDKIKN